nr:hypothetical protein [Apis mellifera nudivirus]
MIHVSTLTYSLTGQSHLLVGGGGGIFHDDKLHKLKPQMVYFFHA